MTDLVDRPVQSPSPLAEWHSILRMVGTEMLADLVGVSVSSVRRYAAGTRVAPDDVSKRLHFLGLIVGDFGGSYSDLGVRAWFGRTRTQLDGQSPEATLRGARGGSSSDATAGNFLA